MWFTIVVTCVVAFYIWKRIRNHSRDLPPGPLNIPLLGSWEFLKLYLSNGNMAAMYERLGAEYGPVVFMRIAMDTPVVAIRTYDAIKEASKDLQLGGIGVPYLYRQMSGWLNYGLSFAEGKNWHDNRRFTIATLGRLGFSRRRIEPLVSFECAMTVQKLTEAAGRPVNIEKLLPGAVVNVMLQLLMSRRFEIDDPQVWKLKRDSIILFNIMAKIQTYLDFAPWLDGLAGKDSVSRRLAGVLDTFYELVDKVIAEHEDALDEDGESQDLLDAYLCAARSQRHPDHILSGANLRVLMKDLVVGGLDGPSIMLSWLLLLLAEHQDVQDRVRDELDTAIGPHRTPAIEDERSCPYTLAVIDETLRFVTLTPFNRHFASAGGATLLGHYIPAGSVLLVDIHSLHHDPAVWGDPEVFRPGRFLTEDGARLRQHVRGFGFSPRACPAEPYSRSMLFLFAAGVLQKLALRLPEGVRVTAGAGYTVSRRPSRPLLVAEPRRCAGTTGSDS